MLLNVSGKVRDCSRIQLQIPPIRRVESLALAFPVQGEHVSDFPLALALCPRAPSSPSVFAFYYTISAHPNLLLSHTNLRIIPTTIPNNFSSPVVKTSGASKKKEGSEAKGCVG